MSVTEDRNKPTTHEFLAAEDQVIRSEISRVDTSEISQLATTELRARYVAALESIRVRDMIIVQQAHALNRAIDSALPESEPLPDDTSRVKNGLRRVAGAAPEPVERAMYSVYRHARSMTQRLRGGA